MDSRTNDGGEHMTTTIEWQSATSLPPAMDTVLIAIEGEVHTAYWDGDEWYSTSGEPLGLRVTHWSLMPALPHVMAMPKVGACA